MSQAGSHILLPQTPYNGKNGIVEGNPVEAAAYYIGQRGLQTFTWNVVTFTGILQLQATLSENPGKYDWFTVYNLPGNQLTQNGFTNIEGNFTYVRAKIINFGFGVVNTVKVSY